MDVADALKIARERLSVAGVADPSREAASLLAFAIKQSHVFLIAHPEYKLSPSERELFENILGRRSAREPFQYIVGVQEFYGLDFEVTQDVLIPRPETEILVEDAIGIMTKLDKPRFMEIGVGSGCISVSVLKNVPDGTAVGIDISPQALAVARRNAAKHEVADRINFVESDLFAGAIGKFDLIVSNPAYIPDADVPELQPEVVVHEPHSALAGGADGLAIVRRIIAGSSEHLNTSGVLLIEIGYGQADAVSGLLDGNVWTEAVFLKDLQGIPRVLKTMLRK